MKRTKRVAAVAALAMISGGLALVAASPASAATPGTSISPATGSMSSTVPKFVATCPAGTVDAQVQISGGPSNWVNWLHTGPGNTAIAGTTVTVTGADSFQGAFSVNGPGGSFADATAALPYVADVQCLNSAFTVTADNTVNFTVTGNATAGAGTFTALSTNAGSTTSQVTTTTTGTITAGTTSVALATTVSVPGVATWAGSVKFFEGAVGSGTQVGTTQNVSNTTPTASTSYIPPLAGGTARTIYAVFTPTTTGVDPSTSLVLNLTVVAPAANTTISLAGSAASIDTNQVATLTATVANATAGGAAPTGGTVTLTNTATSTAVGTATVDATGKATFSLPGSTLGAGNFSFTATYGGQTVGGVTTFNGSGPSNAVTLVVTAATTIFQPAPGDQTIQTNVVPGTLTISGGVTATSGAVTLGFPNITDPSDSKVKYALQLDAGNTALTNNGAAKTDGHNQLYRLVVTDSRSGNTGYTVNGVVTTDFKNVAGNTIDSATLGWTPKVSALCAAGQVPAAPTFTFDPTKVTTGFESTVTNPGVDCSQVAAVAGAPVTPAAPGSGQGLKTARELYHTVAGSSIGTVSSTADLLINAPTTTKSGWYSTKIVLTAVAS